MIDEIKKRMEAKGITQTELGKRLGWPQPLISAYLAGKKTPSVDRAEQMVDALGGEVRIKWKSRTPAADG
jgi:transcriptional regulator with XRE-family HTH domain